MGKIIPYNAEERPFKVWLLFFIYSILVSVIVKFIILPFILPAWHAGNGLMIGGDWLYFDKLAIDLSQKIRSEGWRAWELRPGLIGQAPAGIASAIYALLFPSSAVLIPLNSAMHATSAFLVFLIIKMFITDTRTAFISTIPFLIFPTALIWLTQIHKDSYACLGALFFIYGWLLLSQIKTWQSFRQAFKSVITVFFGIFLVWLVRPYEVRMLQAVELFFIFVLLFIFIYRGMFKRLLWKKVIIANLLFFFILLFSDMFAYENPKSSFVYNRILSGMLNKFSFKTAEKQSTIDITPDGKNVDLLDFPKTNFIAAANSPLNNWHIKDPARINKIWLVIETFSISIANVRYGSINTHGATNIDTDIQFYSVIDIVKYLPRAAQISLFAPFPNTWFKKGNSSLSTFMRFAIVFEMIVIYLSLAAFFYYAARWYKKPQLWLIMIFSMVLMLIFSISIVNVGTLNRLRYPFLMLLCSLGIAGFLRSRTNES